MSSSSSRPTTATFPSGPTISCWLRAVLQPRPRGHADRIVEPVFGADTAYIPDRSQWYTLRFFDRQNYQAFGVRTDRSLRVLREGAAVANLYCVGAGLAGFHPVQEGCGAGVSLLSALYAADQILNSPRS